MKERNGEHPFGDEGQLIAVAIFLLVWIGDSFLLHLTTSFVELVPITIRLAISALTLVVGILLIQSGHGVVSHGQRPDYVVNSGVFRYVRHPLYLGSLMAYLALVISTLSLASFLMWMMIFAFYNYIAGYEEQLLVRKFGEAYLVYTQRTGRWLPRLYPVHS